MADALQSEKGQNIAVAPADAFGPSSLTKHHQQALYSTMLKNAPIRILENERPRRWMLDDYLDLIIWYQPDGSVYGFQICYDKLADERALTWIHTGKFTHNRIDDGEGRAARAKGTPVLLGGGDFDYETLKKEFLNRSAALDSEIRELVLSKMAEANSVLLSKKFP
ncbi:MAG: hypothetical protein WCL08_00695 [Verrucomicrobiota bacterium]